MSKDANPEPTETQRAAEYAEAVAEALEFIDRVPYLDDEGRAMARGMIEELERIGEIAAQITSRLPIIRASLLRGVREAPERLKGDE